MFFVDLGGAKLELVEFKYLILGSFLLNFDQKPGKSFFVDFVDFGGPLMLMFGLNLWS